MNISNDALFLSIFFITFYLGFLSDRLINMNINEQNAQSLKRKKEAQIQSGIDIDDNKLVINIKTDGLEKKYNELGEKALSLDTITSSVDKLKNLKR